MIEALATGAGILGSIAVTKASWRMAGFGIWIVGNLLWISHGIDVGDTWLTVLFSFYEITAIVGFLIALREVKS